MSVIITEAARARINTILADPEISQGGALRVYVQGGGCSGFRYGFNIEENISEDDEVIDIEQGRVVIDPLSAMYLDCAEIDYTKNLSGENIIIRNPNAKTTCGCGQSFGA